MSDTEDVNVEEAENVNIDANPPQEPAEVEETEVVEEEEVETSEQ